MYLAAKIKLQNIINNNMPLIQKVIKEHILTMIDGSITERNNQIMALELLYETLSTTANVLPVPYLGLISTLVRKDDFVEFCIPYADQILGNNPTERIFLHAIEKTQGMTSNPIPITIDNLFIADDLFKLKELVDEDVITIEDYLGKKRQFVALGEVS